MAIFFHVNTLSVYGTRCHDVAKAPECFYHGLMIGLSAYLFQQKDDDLSSNRDSSTGRYNYSILEKNPKKISILFEFIKVESSNKVFDDHLSSVAAAALQQTETRQYIAYARKHHSGKILKIGLAFHGKEIAMASAYDEPSHA